MKKEQKEKKSRDTKVASCIGLLESTSKVLASASSTMLGLNWPNANLPVGRPNLA